MVFPNFFYTTFQNRKDAAALVYVFLAVAVAFASFFPIPDYTSIATEFNTFVIIVGTAYIAAPTIPNRNTWGSFPGLVRILVTLSGLIALFGTNTEMRPLTFQVMLLAWGRTFGVQYSRVNSKENLVDDQVQPLDKEKNVEKIDALPEIDKTQTQVSDIEIPSSKILDPFILIPEGEVDVANISEPTP